MKAIAAISLLLAACTTLAGCAHAPPHAAAAGLLTRAPLSAGNASAAWPETQWWQRYDDADLDAMVERALREAPTLAAARARAEAAAAAVNSARAQRQLQVSLDAQQQRQRLSDNGLFPPQLLGFNWYSTSDLGLNAHYDLDLAGGHLARQRAAIARSAAARADHDAAALGLSFAVVSQYLGWQADNAGLQLALARRDALDNELRLTQLRATAELARADDGLLLQQTREQIEEQLEGYAARMQMRRVALAALLGEAPEGLTAFNAHELPATGVELPASATLDLMARRPDLVAARGRIEAAVADTDVARAGFLPDLDLRALLGLSSLKLDKLLEAGSAAPLVSAALHLPLFDAGQARAEHAGAMAQLQVAVADYNERLQQAAQDINGALAERASGIMQLQLRERQIGTAEQLRTLAVQRTDAGLSDARTQWLATRRWLEAREARVQTQYDLLTADLKLIRALGGGYGAGDERQR